MASVVCRADLDLVDDLLWVRTEYPDDVEVFGLASVAFICAQDGTIDPAAVTLAEQFEDNPLALLDVEEARRDPFADTFPALDRWRQDTLAKKPRDRTPLEAAAAWEVRVVECERAGSLELAEAAREAARKAMLPGRRSA